MTLAVHSHPLTRAQQDVWLAHRLYEDSSVLGGPIMIDCPAAIDASALSLAFQALVDSSDALRTRVVDSPEGPQAITDGSVPAPLEVVRYEGDAPDAFLAGWLGQRVRRRFVLGEPMFDAALITLGPARSIVYLNQHHLITDGWSTRLATKYWGRLYSNALEGRVPEKLELPQFREYVDYLAAHESSRERLDAASFWQRRLSERVPAPALYGRTGGALSGRARRMPCSMGEDRTAALRRVAQSLCARGDSANHAAVAVFTACVAVYQWRVSGATTLAVGIPYHNRLPQFRDTLGLFVNVVPCIVRLDPRATFADVVAQVSAELRTVLGHGHYPITQSLSSPRYHSAVNYHVRHVGQFGPFQASQTRIASGHLDECLSLEVRRTADGAFSVDLDLRDDLFDETQALRAVQHFLAVVDACGSNAQQSIAGPALVTVPEARMLEEWSTTDCIDAPRPTCVASVQANARRTPDAVAVVDGRTSITYRELVERARGVAAGLKQTLAGSARGICIGVAMERSIDGMASVLGVLCAAATWVPVDLDWPDERIAFVINDAGVRHILSNDVHADRLRTIVGDRAVVLTGLRCGAATSSCDDGAESLEEPSEADLAYVIYTSGSTGRPKGVAIAHAALSNYLGAAQRVLGVAPHDRVLQFHNLAFDVAVAELWLAWTSGAALVLRNQEIGRDPAALNGFIDHHAVTVVDLPTAYWHEWARALEMHAASPPLCLRLVIVGGEAPSSAVLRSFRSGAGRLVRWVNEYGPTETTIGASMFEADDTIPDPVPIGRPLANIRMRVLDEHLQPQPIGVAGELFVGGAAVARGYVNRPELSAERFPSVSGERMYRTGDMVRYRDDGQLEYLGRADDQMKIRGYRVEPMEIEQALARHPGISQSAVIARPDATGANRLEAYVVRRHGAADDDVRAFLRRILPDYLVPSSIVECDSLPLTTNGKVDRAALVSARGSRGRPSPANTRHGLVNDELLAIWKQLLQVDTVEPEDTFVSLGGHSLLAARMIHAVAERLGRTLPLSIMFPDATVQKLAAALNDAASDAWSGPVYRLNPNGTKPQFVYFHGDYVGGGLYAARLARLLGPDQPLIVVHPHGVDGMPVPATVEEMADERVRAVLQLCPDGPFVLGGYCNGGLVALEAAHRLRELGHAVGTLVVIDARIRTGPFRALAAVVGACARLRRWSATSRRNRFFKWRDRQIAVAELLGVRPTQRFRGTSARLAFVLDSLARRVARVRSHRARFATAVADAPADTHTRLWAAYAAAMDAYVPRPYEGDVHVVGSSQVLDEDAEREWRRTARSVYVSRIDGGHRACVVEHLPSVADLIRGAIESTRQ